MSSFDPSFEFVLIPLLACGGLQRIPVNQLLIYGILLDGLQRISINQLLIYGILLDCRRYSLGDTISICTYLSYFICIFKLTLFCIHLYKWKSSTPQSVVVLQIFLRTIDYLMNFCHAFNGYVISSTFSRPKTIRWCLNSLCFPNDTISSTRTLLLGLISAYCLS